MARTFKQEQQLLLARELLSQKDMAGAEVSYRKILRKDSTDYEAAYELGMLLLKNGQLEEAVNLFKKTSLLIPDFPAVFNNLGIALERLERLEEALDAFDRAITLMPAYTTALFNRGMIHRALSNFDKAISDFTAVLKIEKSNFEAFVALGRTFAEAEEYPEAIRALDCAIDNGAPRSLVLIDLGNIELQRLNYEGALSLYNEALKETPDNPKPWHQKGLALSKLDRWDEALECFMKATMVDSSFAKAFIQAGNILNERNETSAAIELLARCSSNEKEAASVFGLLGKLYEKVEDGEHAYLFYEKAFALDGKRIDCMFSAAKLASKAEQPERALMLIQKGLEKLPDDPMLLGNHGIVLRQMGRFQEAMTFYDRALQKDPELVGAIANKGQLLMDMGCWEEGKAFCEQALNKDPNAPSVRFNLGHYYLLHKQFDPGWSYYEARLELLDDRLLDKTIKSIAQKRGAHHISQSEVKDKRILLLEEQGIGDNVMFASILPDLIRDAHSVNLLTQQRLHNLLTRSFPTLRVHEHGELTDEIIDSKFDIVLLFGSLGFTYRREISKFPGVPYLVPNDAAIRTWRTRLPRGKKLIGISWKGGATNISRTGRSLTLFDFLPLFNREDLEIVNLQFGDTELEQMNFHEKTGASLINFPQNEIYEIDQLASLISALDGVVTVQNTNVHICGAVGQKCHAILPEVPEWRYGLTGTSMPWYQTVSLHRRNADDAKLIISQLAATF